MNLGLSLGLGSRSGSGGAVTPAPTITSTSPNPVSTAGATVVTITGTNLTGATATYDSSPLTLTPINATSASYVQPATIAGSHDLVATTAGGSTAPYATTSQAPVVLTSTSPSSTSNAGGATITVTGTAMGNATGVTLDGGGGSVAITPINSTSFSFTMPATTAGTRTITAQSAIGNSNSINITSTAAAVDISFRASASASSTSTSPAVVTLPTYVATDKLLLFVRYGTTGGTITTPSGWDPAGTVGTGPGTTPLWNAYERIADGSEGSTVSVTFTGTGSCSAIAASYSKDASRTWQTTGFASGSTAVSSTAISVTAGSDPGYDAADMAVCASKTTTGPSSAQSLAATGATIGALTERLDLAQQCLTDKLCSAGPSSAAPVYTGTNSGATNGALVLFVRLRAT